MAAVGTTEGAQRSLMYEDVEETSRDPRGDFSSTTGFG